MRMTRMLLLGGAAALGSWLFSRAKKGPAERAGSRLDKAADQTKTAMEDLTSPTPGRY